MSVLKFTFKTGVYILVTLLLLFALCLQGVRTVLFFADKYHNHIESFLSERLSADVSLGHINANWYGLRPTIELHDLEVVSRIDASTVSASHALVVFDLSDTFLQLTPVFKHVSFSDLSLSVYQNQNGAWSDSGFFRSNTNSVGSWRYRSPADLFNTVKFAELKNTQIKLRFFDGRVLDTVFPYSDIINDGNNHYLNISASVDDDKDVFSIRVEGIGQPSEPDKFHAKALVELKQFPAGRMAQLLVDQNLTIDELNNTMLDAQLWFDFDTTRHFSLSGDFAFSGNVQALEQANALQLEKLTDFYQIPLSATITADYEFNKHFDITFQDILFDSQVSLDPVKLSFFENTLKLATNKIALQPLTNWMTTRLADSSVKRAVAELAPRGELHHIQLQSETDDFSKLVMQTHAKGVSIDSYQEVPQFERITGFVKTSLTNGVLILDSKDVVVTSQPFFNESFKAQTVSGEITWQLSPATNNISIQGKGLSAQAVFGNANAYFDLDLPWRPNTGASHLLLQLGLQKSSAEYSSLFLPTTLPKDFTDWLDTAVKQADINSAGVLYRGSLGDEGDRAIQVHLDIANGQMVYQPDWPALNNISGSIVFDDNQAVAQLTQASTYDDVMQGTISWNTQLQNRLNIQASVAASAQTALLFVKNTPLKQQAEVITLWEVGGDLDFDLDLLFGLDPSSEFASQIVEMKLSNNRLYLPDQNIEFTQANGTIFYSSENGFSSSDLNGLLFDERTLIDLKTQTNGDLLLSGTGGVSVFTLAKWLEQPLISALGKGSLNYTFDFLVPEMPDDTFEPVISTQTLSIYSDLNDVKIELPEPFGKSFETPRDFLLKAGFTDNQSNFEIQLGDHLYSMINFLDEETFKATLAVSDQGIFSVPDSFIAEHQNKAEGLFIYGDFLEVNVEPWLPFFDTLDAVNDEAAETFPVYYTLQTQSLQFDELALENVSVSGFNVSDVWENTIGSDTVAGNIFFRETDVIPLTINLDYLLLPKAEEPVASIVQSKLPTEIVEETIDPLADIAFEDIYSADVTIDYLEYDGRPLGNWSFVVESNPGVILVKDIQAIIADLSLTGVAQSEGASLRWSRDGVEEQTTFYGRINGGSLEYVFERWNLPPAVTNEKLYGSINLQWAGSPMAATVASLNGDINFLLENGIFTQTGSGTTGFLRVLSFLNFDTWVKRLRLDFSGVLDEGMAFDNVSGRLNFDRGIIQLTEPVEVNSSSITLSLSGLVDYPNDSIDGNLGVVLPVGGNLNFAAALAAGLPAALGVYLVRKIFADEISQASTVNYIVSGSLNKPEIKFNAGDTPEEIN